jgi:hypothetical protein
VVELRPYPAHDSRKTAALPLTVYGFVSAAQAGQAADHGLKGNGPPARFIFDSYTTALMHDTLKFPV